MRPSSRREIAFIPVVTSVVTVFGILLYKHGNTNAGWLVRTSAGAQRGESGEQRVPERETPQLTVRPDLQRLRQQRIAMSQKMNALMHTLAKQSCSITNKNVEGHGNKGKKNSNIALTGGWCKNESKEGGGHHMTDRRLVKHMSIFFAGKRVGSFGDGPGVYKRELLKLGQVASYDAFDGAPFCEETSDGRVQYMDLTVPQYGVAVYDWVLSLEVAEHIPAEFEDHYVDNLVRHAREGIVLSWGTPGQGGTGHINLRPIDYVQKKLKMKGFVRDAEASKSFEKQASFTWFKAHPPWNKEQTEGNIQVFTREPGSPVDPMEA